MTIAPEPKYPFRILEAQPVKANNLRCQVEGSGQSQGPFQLRIENIRSTPGRYSEQILVKTDSEMQPELRIPVYGNIIAAPAPAPDPEVNSDPPEKPDAAQSQP
ncbi:MAG: hypothetical protein WBG37_16460 [Desulfobacterales bacterium]